MKRPKSEVLTFKMTRQRALEKDLLTCSCGHPENNHFDFKAHPCAHCDCKGFDEVSRAGTLTYDG